jgi:ribA/ribD-fused uncharacterized protein
MSEIKFWGMHGTWGFLSNFYASPMMVDGKVYRTNEHYFQSQKFAGTEYEEYIRLLSTPAETAREGKRRDFPLRKDWESVKEEIMLTGLRAKFRDNFLRHRLISTGDEILIEDSPYDFYWGVGRDGTGKNRLGILLMQVREELNSV